MIKNMRHYYCDNCGKELESNTQEYLMPRYVELMVEGGFGGIVNMQAKNLQPMTVHLCDKCASKIACLSY